MSQSYGFGRNHDFYNSRINSKKQCCIVVYEFNNNSIKKELIR